MNKVCTLFILASITLLVIGCSVQSAKFTYHTSNKAWQQAHENTFQYQDLSVKVMANDIFKISTNKASARQNGPRSPSQTTTAFEIILFMNSTEKQYMLSSHSVTLTYQDETLSPISFYYGKTQDSACIGLLSKKIITISPEKHACVVYKFNTDRILLHSTLVLHGKLAAPHPDAPVLTDTDFTLPFSINIES